MKLAPEAQCLANIRAWLRWTGLDYTAEPLRTAPDRAVWPRNAVLEQHIASLVERKVLLAAPSQYKGEDVICGYREDVGMCSAQVIIRQGGVEIDFDHFNPTRDVVGAVGHGVEVLQNKFGRRLTDPARIERMLRKRGVYAV